VRSIPIVVHSDEIDDVFPTSYALYAGKKCWCRGDGERAIRKRTNGNEYIGGEDEIQCPCPYLNAEKGPMCKPNGKLYCSIALPGSAIAGAVHIWRTTSIISVQRMIGSLEQIKAVCGTLRGIPLVLVLDRIEVEHAGKPTTVYCCHVELRAKDIQAVQRMALDAMAMRRRLGHDDAAYRKMISLPAHNESDDEQAEIQTEFYPDEKPHKLEGHGVSSADVTAAIVEDEKKQTVDVVVEQKQDDGNAPY
jgi:hypothetical protein